MNFDQQFVERVQATLNNACESVDRQTLHHQEILKSVEARIDDWNQRTEVLVVWAFGVGCFVPTWIFDFLIAA